MEQKSEQVVTDNDKATQYLYELALKLLELKGSDIFITAGSPAAFKINQEIRRVGGPSLSPQQVALLVRSIMNDRQAREFDQNREANFSLNFPDVARFRVSAFTQRGSSGMVLRLIQQQIPTLDELNLPPILHDIALAKRGLVIFLGGTGCGKTTSMAAMLDHRNSQCREHIITIEDPIEFFHRHKLSLVDQREVGVDTDSYDTALKNTLRQAPNVILIGEVRDRETMQSVINFAETGHLCLTTLHANTTDQAFDRIINFFPEERRTQILMDLSFNMKAFISQRLLPRVDQPGLIPAVEILLNTPLMAELIFQGRIKEIKTMMMRSSDQGIITFDMALFDLYEAGQIGYETAIRHADSANNLRLKIKLESKRPPPRAAGDSNSQLNVDPDQRRR
ncbi:MAG: PilT/PilU family type 4a pilus ATPase [Candidatus Competibacteraceae bacterium]|nr:PilT/PilU family type 4a pilus ATPase [Candidatus Competibacteraceae bacterium]MBK7983844.1 PilT/PilU family type 4a pilus ATPase [Candidatus Competibacteraceae bacterium]MBK8897615.1 PilT/PilU family type 4a pilus ATPase [Candidatus Competibacteraceae bacterium]MBK8963759.1 PilT/PilU family type 4a pilus ATPase [Candidatus Competibacteraceae bacterium]MBK9950651.1 PilT/PilU family type 4a pilus ATPase [Candidatus Competibacteraceae bacterium]